MAPIEMDSNSWSLIAKHLTGEISSDEKIELLKWANKSPDNAELLKKAERLWELSGKFNFALKLDKERDWAALKDRILAESTQEHAPVQNQNRYRWVKIAASLILLMGVGFILRTFLEEDVMSDLADQSEIITYSEPILYSVPIVYICVETTDSTNMFYLPDSTSVWLNKNSSLLYPEKFTGEVRDVQLVGEAFFKVVRDSLNPFIVGAGNTQIKVLGTSFNVRAYEEDNEVEVIVVEGKVEFSSLYRQVEKKVILEGDEKATYQKKEQTYTKEKYEARGFKWRLRDIGHDVNQFIRTISKRLRGNKKRKRQK